MLRRQILREELMNIDKVQAKLLSVIRDQPLNTQVPLGFEKRIIARIRGILKEGERQEGWILVWWRIALACLVIGIGVSVLSTIYSNKEQSFPLSQHLETTMYAAIDETFTGW